MKPLASEDGSLPYSGCRWAMSLADLETLDGFAKLVNGG